MEVTYGWVKDSLSRFTILGYAHSYPTALEAFLKFTEASYVPAVALGALEFRHGPVATVGELIRIFRSFKPDLIITVTQTYL